MTIVTKQSFRLGESGWEVDWCIKVGLLDEADPSLGCDPDLDKRKYRYFRDRDEARRFAEQVYPQDGYGCVTVTPFVIELLCDEWPHGRQLVYTSESEHYSGEWE